MEIISYNVNGIRASIKNGLLDWLSESLPDVLCLQEVKANQDQLSMKPFEELGYKYIYWMPAQKKGYSGVAILCRQAPINHELGCGIDCYDLEGRVIRVDYTDFSVLNLYMPSGTTGDVRQSFKMKWLDDFLEYVEKLRSEIPRLIICGDFNICHQPIDIHDPVGNKNSSGFLPEERSWLTNFITYGYIDTFRYFNSDPHFYTWWSYRRQARDRNLGWRIDYHFVTENLRERLKRSVILSDAVHSDHCPILLEID